jgi:hypothetical protein
MAGVTAQGASFSYNGFRGSVSGISIETPSAEVTDMAAIGDGNGIQKLVPTGGLTGGTITVDFLTSGGDPQGLVRSVGQLSFSSAGYSVARRVLCESASVTAQAGELVRGSIRFRITDYMGT